MSGRMRGRLLDAALAAAVLVGALSLPGSAAAEPAEPVPTLTAAQEATAAPGSAGTAHDDVPATTASGGIIQAKYQSLGGAAGPLGAPVDVEHCYPAGCTQRYENGEIVWAEGRVHAITDPDIWLEWTYSGGLAGWGPPTSDTFCGLRDGGCGQHFTIASLYWVPALGVVPVTHYIRPAWAVAGWEHGLGYPLAEWACGLVGGGCLQEFERGMVYRTAGGRAVAVFDGPLADRWAAQGWERGPLGYPTAPRFCGLRGGGCGQHFDGGSVYWSPGTPARVVPRDGLSRWASMGWENGQLGYPVSEPFTHRDGRYGQHFQGGSLYSMTDTDVRFVPAAIRDRWGAQGWERGPLGYPKAEPFCGLRDGGCGQHFYGGSIYWSPSTGARVLSGGIYLGYESNRWELGPLGLPIGEMFCGLRNGGCGQHFQGGSIYSHGPAVAEGGRYVVGRAVVEPWRSAWAARGWERGPWGYPLSDPMWTASGYGQYYEFGGFRPVVNGQVR